MQRTGLWIARSLGVTVLVACSCARAGLIWDFTNQFSIANGNPNGDWSYGWADSSGFHLHSHVSTPNSNSQGWAESEVGPLVWKNIGTVLQSGVLPGQVSLHTGPGPAYTPSVVRWTAPAGLTGLASVLGQFFAGDAGTMLVGVFTNGVGQGQTPMWSASNAGTFNLNVGVSPGSTVDFVVWGGYGQGNTPLAVQIDAVPEPATVTLCVLAAFAGISMRRRRKARTSAAPGVLFARRRAE